jgi:hypothetical protein
LLNPAVPLIAAVLTVKKEASKPVMALSVEIRVQLWLSALLKFSAFPFTSGPMLESDQRLMLKSGVPLSPLRSSVPVRL